MSKLNLGDSLILDTDYSTSEVKTGATWIDGKPIYRKVLNYTSDTTNIQEIAHNISNLGVVMSCIVWCGDASSTAQRFVNFTFNGNLNWHCGFYVTQTVVGLEKGSSWISNYTGKQGYIILEYTKTTD